MDSALGLHRSGLQCFRLAICHHQKHELTGSVTPALHFLRVDALGLGCTSEAFLEGERRIPPSGTDAENQDGCCIAVSYAFVPPQFPQEKTVISVFPPVRHHLMDKQGVYVTGPLISNFTMHLDLGKIVQSLLDEFWKNPPVLAPSSTSFPYLFNKPAGIPPYAPQGFPFLPPYPPKETNRIMAAVPVAESV